MKKFNTRLVYDYIFGNDIFEYDIDELENNPEFMIEVIKYSKDKNTYNIANENVKRNHDVVKLVINLFKDDLEYVCKVADYYLSVEKDEKQTIDILDLMATITEKKDVGLYFKYKIPIQAKHEEIMIAIEAENAQNLMLGFYLILEDYEGNNDAIDAFAKVYLADIFEDIEFEEDIYKSFKSLERFNYYGANEYLINKVRAQDDDLADYLMVHPYLLKEYTIRVKKYVSDFEKNRKKQEENLFQSIIETCESYIRSKAYGLDYSILYTIAAELNIYHKFREYYNAFLTEEEIEYIENEYGIDTSHIERINEIQKNQDYKDYKEIFNELDKESKRHYTQLKKIFSKILRKKEEFDDYTDDGLDDDGNSSLIEKRKYAKVFELPIKKEG